MMYRNTPLSEKEKAYMRRVNGIKKPFAADIVRPSKVKTVREYLAPTSLELPRRTRRGSNGCKLSHEKRQMVLARGEARLTFLRSLGVQV